MPKYELMYILAATVSDNDAPTVSAEIDEFIKAAGGTIIAQEFLGKKKLAYPIKKTRNGFYVLQTFDLAGPQIIELDNKLRSIELVIRYIIVNVGELERRKEKDREVQERMKISRKPKKAPVVAAVVPEIKLTESELEQKIERALGSEDLSK